MHSRRSMLASLIAPALAARAAATRPPNILFVLADDLGWRDVGYQGSDFYETPNLDQFARNALVFGNAYASAANCAPSRACLLSGQYTPRHHIYAVDSTLRGPVDKMRMVPVPSETRLAPSFVTFGEALKSAGYATAHFGKWHLGDDGGCEPTAQGFDVSWNPRPNPNQRQDIPADPKGIFSMTRAAGDFMERHREHPFCVYLAHHAIHTALEAQPATIDHFRAKAKGTQHRDAMYAACLRDLDQGFGQLMARLDALGLAQNTLVLFASDNGGTQQSSQEPLRGNKGCYYEGGIRVPAMVRWPGVTRPGSVCAVPVSNIDFYPTFLACARTAPRGPLDGADLTPLLRGGKSLKRNSLFWHFPGYLNDPVIRGRDPVFRSRPVSVIRKGDWKLHLYHEEWQLDGGRARLAENHAVELYNLKQDEGEHRDLALTEPRRRDELLDDLLRWIERTGAPLPRQGNPRYRAD